MLGGGGTNGNIDIHIHAIVSPRDGGGGVGGALERAAEENNREDNEGEGEQEEEEEEEEEEGFASRQIDFGGGEEDLYGERNVGEQFEGESLEVVRGADRDANVDGGQGAEVDESFESAGSSMNGAVYGGDAVGDEAACGVVDISATAAAGKKELKNVGDGNASEKNKVKRENKKDREKRKSSSVGMLGKLFRKTLGRKKS